MNERTKNLVIVWALLLLLSSLTLACLIKPAGDISLTERRPLAQFPELSFTTLANGSFMRGFESYATDQFPCAMPSVPCAPMRCRPWDNPTATIFTCTTAMPRRSNTPCTRKASIMLPNALPGCMTVS